MKKQMPGVFNNSLAVLVIISRKTSLGSPDAFVMKHVEYSREFIKDKVTKSLDLVVVQSLRYLYKAELTRAR